MDQDTLPQDRVGEAWRRFAAGDLDAALVLAHQACKGAAPPAQAAAALGFFLIQAGDLDQAATVLALGCDRNPDFAPLHWYTGYLLQRRGDAAGAVIAFQHACEQDPTLDEAAYALAWALHDTGRVPEACPWSDRALAARRSPERLLQSGWLRQRLGQAARAVTFYQEALADPSVDASIASRLRLHLSQCQVLLGQLQESIATLRAALLLGPEDADLMTEMGNRLRQQGAGGAAEIEQAQMWADRAVDAQPNHCGAHLLKVQLALDRGDAGSARRRLALLLRDKPGHADAWRLLGSTAAARHRPGAALRWLRRAMRLDGGNAETLRALAWVLAANGDGDAAVDTVRQLLSLTPNDPATQIQGALLMAPHGQLQRAERLAEQALANSPNVPDAWRAMSEVRLRQRRWAEALWAIDRALELLPERADYWRHLGWIFMESGQPARAVSALEQARRLQPDEPFIVLELARAHQRGGAAAMAHALVEDVLARRPQLALARELLVHVLAEGGTDMPADVQAAHTGLVALLEAQPDEPRLLAQAVRLAALGCDAAAQAVEVATPARRNAALIDACTRAVHLHGFADAQRLATLSRRLQPDDGWLECAALLQASMDPAVSLPSLALQAREWARGMRAHAAPGRVAARTGPAGASSRPRLAYLCSQPHHALLERVLAAHGKEVEVFLFTDEPQHDLPPNVYVYPLVTGQLGEVCAANAIEVVIDTGGLHPLGSLDISRGQYGVLTALAGRIAPVQVAWLGTWGSSGGLFDALLTDRISVPRDHEQHYEEAVIALEGGMWCWSPPVYAPPVSLSPAARNGHVTFGVIARPVRLNQPALRTIAQVVAGSPNAQVRLVGAIASDWPSRRSVLAIFAAQGVQAARVHFEPSRGRAEFLAWFGSIDLVLDTFPGSGGLSLLDALWMGVPVVTLAGGWAGARQGASILGSIGRPEWVTPDNTAYVATAMALAGNLSALEQERAGLRARMAAAPLLDGVRLARQIEAFCRSVQPHARAVMAAPDARSRMHALVAWELEQWLRKPGATLTLCKHPPHSLPVLSVVVVHSGQAGLTRRCLQSLADQHGVEFETVVVDNSTCDRMVQLMARVHGAHKVRGGGDTAFFLSAHQGAEVVRGRFIVFISSACVLRAGALQACTAALVADRSLGALGAGLGAPEDGVRERGGDGAPCAFLATPAPLWRQLGGFVDESAGATFDDAGYCLRVRRAGLRVEAEPRVMVDCFEAAV